MTIFLSVLKIIGIVLLIILCVVVALVLLILFVPIFYDADGNSTQKRAGIRIRWLFGLIRFRLEYQHDSGTEYELRILWFHILPRKSSSGRRKGRRKKNKKHSVPKADKEADSKKSENAPESIRNSEDFSESVKLEDSSGKISTSGQQEAGSVSEPSKADSLDNWISGDDDSWMHDKAVQRDSTVSRKDRRAGVFHKGTSRHTDRKRRREEKKMNAAERKNKVQDVLSVIRTIHDSGLIEKVFPPLQRMLWRIRPRYLTGEVAFGLSNPADTGMICGLLSMIPGVLGSNLMFRPDFEAEKNYLRGHAELKGHIQLVFVLIFALRLLLNKKIRTTIKKLGNR